MGSGAIANFKSLNKLITENERFGERAIREHLVGQKKMGVLKAKGAKIRRNRCRAFILILVTI